MTTSRGYFRGEADFPGPRRWRPPRAGLRRTQASTSSFFLMVDEFDPHEPFDTPEPYASLGTIRRGKVRISFGRPMSWAAWRRAFSLKDRLGRSGPATAAS